MNEAADSTTLALTGKLPFILLVSGLLALLVSFILLRLYRRSIVKVMRQRSGLPPQTAGPPADTATPAGDGSPQLTLDYITDAAALRGGALYRRAQMLPWRAAAIYGAGGMLFAAVAAMSFLLSTKIPFLPLRFFFLVWTFLWPLVPTVILVACPERRPAVLSVAAYFFVLAGLLVTAFLRDPTIELFPLITYWVTTNIPPTILLAVFLLKNVRAVGPMVLTFLVIALTGAIAAIDLASQNDEMLRSVAGVGFDLGLGATGVFFGLQLIGFLAFGVVGWMVLRRIRKWYSAKQVTDQSLTLDSLWLMFGIVYSMTLVFEGALWIFSGLVAFAVYKAIVRVGFILAGSGKPTHTAKRLLLLRVFSLGARSERLFHSVSKLWRYVGPVQLISGPDLAQATIEPHEFLDFVTGKIRRNFINSGQALEERLVETDVRADFDGRFRVNDFFCFDDTWRMTLTRLVGESDVILMDLRGFTRRNAGCIYELKHLISAAPISQLVLTVDGTTDTGLVEESIQEAWRRRPTQGTSDEPASLRIQKMGHSPDRSMRSLMRCLSEAAGTRE